MRFQVPPKTCNDSWITQRIRHWVPNCRTGDLHERRTGREHSLHCVVW